jgi:hypothetical protein
LVTQLPEAPRGHFALEFPRNLKVITNGAQMPANLRICDVPWIVRDIVQHHVRRIGCTRCDLNQFVGEHVD